MEVVIRDYNFDKNGANPNTLTLPVVPSEVMVSAQQNNTAVRVYGVGESNLKGDVGLRSVTISSFLPAQPYDFMVSQSYSPVAQEAQLDRLRKWFEANETLDLCITEGAYMGGTSDVAGRWGGGLLITGTIESLTYGWKGGNGDKPYTIVFKELRQIERPWQAAAAASSSGAAAQRATKAVKTKVVKWKKGDTWAKVVKRVRGSSKGWRKVRKANRAVVNKAKRANPKKKERLALVGYKVKVTAK